MSGAQVPAQAHDARDAALGATALLRLGGMPGEAWTAGAAPHLFEGAARHADTVERLAAQCRALADRLGAEVVPHPLLAPADRGAVLALRRRLHSGTPPRVPDCLLLRQSPAVPADLTEQAHALLDEAEAAETDLNGLRQAVAAEQRRGAEQVWRTARSSPVLRAFVDSAAPGLAEDVAQRLASGQSWSGRQLRKRAAYLWRILGRAAAKTTPRGWAGQIAALPVTCGPGGCPALLSPGTPLGALAALAVENVHLIRARSAPPDLRTADPRTLLAPAPLHFAEPAAIPPGEGPGQVRCYVVDPRDPGRLRQVVLRRTGVLEAVLALLADGPRTLGDLEGTLPALAAPAGRPAPAAGVVRGFLQHLHSLGVVQVCRAPRQHRSGWVPAGTVASCGTLPQAPAGSGSGAWFLDSYRRPGADAAVPGPAVARVAHGLRIAARIAALRAARRRPAALAGRLPAAPPALPRRARAGGRAGDRLGRRGARRTVRRRAARPVRRLRQQRRLPRLPRRRRAPHRCPLRRPARAAADRAGRQRRTPPRHDLLVDRRPGPHAVLRPARPARALPSAGPHQPAPQPRRDRRRGGR
ncbi:hypothetical protein [Streptomyces mexicanus]|uniref:hypothetical protein n=1 Tax=Streptomyces mexicanus TaxID=178566 RepID=UPI001F2B4C1D|nr:hypothetical protein [Streptomyces mexicanus]